MGVQEEVLRFDIAVTDADGVDVGEGAKELIHVKFDLEDGHRLLELYIVSAGTVYGLWHKFEDEIEVYFVLLLYCRGGEVRLNHQSIRE